MMNQDHQYKQNHSFDQHFQSVLLRTELYGMSPGAEEKCFKLAGIIWVLGHLTY